MVVAPAVHDGAVSHPDTSEAARTTASPRFRLALAGVLALALVGSLIWLGLVLVGNADGDTASREGDRATVQSNGYAWNCMEGNGDPLWEVWGTYEHRLLRSGAGWKVDGFIFRMTHERGNPWVKATPGQ